MLFGKFRQEIAGAATVAPVKPAWAAGLRGAIATMVPIAVGGAFGWAGASWMGLAGFCASTADKGGAYRTRAEAMTAVGVFGAIAAILGSVAGRAPWPGIFLMAAIVTFCTVVRVYGQAAINVGTNAIVMYIVGLSAPCSAAEALPRGGAILAGAAWAMVIALALWPIRFYRPARLAIGDAFRRIAAYANDVARLTREQLSPQERHSLFVGDYDATFAAIEHARDVLTAIRRGRQMETRRGERLLVLLEKADRAFARLASLAEAVEAQNSDADPEALQQIAAACEAIARVLESERNEPIAPVTRQTASVLLRELERAIDDAAESALGVSSERARGVFEAHRHRETLLGTLRTVLTWRSIVFRHALRVGVATAIGAGLTELLHLRRGYWVTFSVFIILQPYSNATLRKGLQRIAGTLVGGLLAAAAVALVHSELGVTILIFVGAFVCLALLPVNYALYAVFMTPTFILLAELGAHDWHLAGVRIVNTLIGCTLGFLAARLLWPSSERAEIRDEIIAIVAALAGYVRAVMTGDEVAGIRARRGAQLALQNGDAALQQALSDPEARRGTSEPAMAIIVHGRRFALALSALAVETRGHRSDAVPLLGAVASALESIAKQLETSEPAPPLQIGGETGPLVRQVETIQSAAARFSA